MHDLVIRGGTLIDGTGAPAREGDLAIRGGRVAEIGKVSEKGRRELDARGLLVAPGFVDVHTHYDGQATWDALMTPSVWHGVTTVVMGNCGVGFAPVKPDRHDWLIALMEGVEDIPGTALAEGMSWGWESFPEYLDALAGMARTIDVGAQLPHAALRTYVMGDRGGKHGERPSAEEIARMGALAREAMEAGAFGFSTSRTVLHRSRDGEATPSLSASRDELLGIARGIGAARRGVLQAVADFFDQEAEFGVLCAMAEESGRPLSLTVLDRPAPSGDWRELMKLIEAANARGVAVRAQIAPRPVGLLLGLEGTAQALGASATYRELRPMPLAKRLEQLRRPEVRVRILAELEEGGSGGRGVDFANTYLLGDPPDYEPDPSSSLGALAARRGTTASALAYDELIAGDGGNLLVAFVMNYRQGNLDSTRDMLLHPLAVPGLGDAGAHCSLICDGSFPTSLVTHWGRDRKRGEKLPIEWLFKLQTRDTAHLVGLRDRGVLAPGMKADVNLIDWSALAAGRPVMADDLPAGGKRLLQRARGYRATLVAGEIVMQDGEPTGALPGRLVRSSEEARA
jgi:N-acyl-D-aspartate/D-glutamate deacylase